LTPPGGRIAVVAGDNGVALVHYARREGWVAPSFWTTDSRRDWLERCRLAGVEHAVIFRERNQPPAQTAVLDELTAGYSAVIRGPNFDVVRLDRPPAPHARR
jgi:hypothetical protein